MDSTSKGGFLISYAANEKEPLPVNAIGYGEKITDLRPFNADEYLKKLLDL
jgi:fused signal recognition particle receptor